MANFLIEVPHEGNQASCERAIKIFLATGSHFLTNAGWGCKEGDHKACLMVDVENKAEAMRIIPPAYRTEARITEMIKYSRADFEDADQEHHS
jgi:hypothetical protein